MNFHCSEFWDKYLANDAPQCLTKFFESRGEQKIEVNPWRDASTDEEVNYDGKTIK